MVSSLGILFLPMSHIYPRIEKSGLSEIEINGTLDKINIEWEDCACVTVVAASGGYPVNVIKGYPITMGEISGATVFYAGTAMKDGVLVTNGGRVLAVTAKGTSLENAREIAYREIAKITFTDMRYRSDIARIKA